MRDRRATATIHDVTDTPTEPAAPKPSPKADVAERQQGRWSIPAWPAVALVSVGITVGVIAFVLLRMVLDRDSAPKYNDEQVAQAKTKICTEYQKVRQGVVLNTGRNIGEDPAAVFATAANARMALFDGSAFMLTKLAEEPATPAELAAAVRSVADVSQQLTIDYLAELPDLDTQASLTAVDTASAKVFEICNQ
jgi:hypothetical protein